jgi:hypothetical protein
VARLRTLIPLALAAALLALGCSAADPPESERLGDLGEEIVPAGSELLEVSEGSCPQLAGNPSCARVFFTSARPENERADALEDAARAAGWEVVSREPRSDGILIELGREGYRAFVAIWEDERARACSEEPDTDCADELQVFEDV